MLSQTNITPSTQLGANPIAGGGVTFRVWAPRATDVYLNGTFGANTYVNNDANGRLTKDASGYWAGFESDANSGDEYTFYVVNSSKGHKRDPYARQLKEAGFPDSNSIVCDPDSYPWHDGWFQTPDYSNLIVYQIHIGTYAISRPGIASNFLDVVEKIPYLQALGINMLQPMPIDELEANPNLGYNGADLFSPDFLYVCNDPALLPGYLSTVNGLLASKAQPQLQLADIRPGPNQLKVLVDLCHLHGIAIAFDVVYNHAGGFSVNNSLDDNCLYYMDRVPNRGNNNDSLYFTDQDRGTGGLSFALWNRPVAQLLIDNARAFLAEYHVDGFRYDEIRPGSFDTKARLADLDADGVYAQMLYPSVTLAGARTYADDRELQMACVRAYNEWLVEFCAGSNGRLIGQTIIPTTGVEDAVAELRWGLDHGMKGALIAAYPDGTYASPGPANDAFWDLAQESGTPLVNSLARALISSRPSTATFSSFTRRLALDNSSELKVSRKRANDASSRVSLSCAHRS